MAAIVNVFGRIAAAAAAAGAAAGAAAAVPDLREIEFLKFLLDPEEVVGDMDPIL